MLSLRVGGWSFTSIAFLFACDRKSVEKQCKKYDAKPEDKVYTIERITIHTIKPILEDKWIERNGEKVNKGMNYEDYLSRQYPHRKTSVKG